MTSVLRTGIDLVEIDRLDQVNEAIRIRFVQRVFTAREQALCGGSPASLAGRFAAKEAVAKALGVGIGVVAWQEIEILSGEAGQPVLELHGNARWIAQQQGLAVWSVSISHSRTQAVAVAVAMEANHGEFPPGSGHAAPADPIDHR